MAFDIEMIKTVYASFAKKVEVARNVLNKPLTLTEKILYAHLTDGLATKEFKRVKDDEGKTVRIVTYIVFLEALDSFCGNVYFAKAVVVVAAKM
ncbi:MAG: hypothetical protein FJ218_09915 [Ignavibacteria bacterium]|nr:hypothetical protein [Ignavibacteria bacterium]